MQSVWVTSSLTTALVPTAVALGNFDGLHLGHRQVISPVVTALPSSEAMKSEAMKSEAMKRTYASVVTFHPHPQEFFTGQSRSLLTPLNEKVAVLKQIGIEQLVLLPFNRELANLSPQEFVEKILVHQLQASCISVGADFCFGKQRAGTANELQAIASGYGIQVAIAPLKLLDGERISSSAIRSALQTGDLQTANRLLGRAYSLVGQVVHGQHLGRTLGFPTANLQLPPEKFMPRFGVYAVRVQVCQAAERQAVNYCLGVMNIGDRPTVEGKQMVAEVHLFDWSGDLYGQTLIVNLEAFLRPEQKFASLDDLKAQIQTDCEAAQALLTKSKTAEKE